MKAKDIQTLVSMLQTEDIGGDLVHFGAQSSIKSRFKTLSVAYLKHLSKLLDLKDFEVSFNPGGPGVSGEATLRSERVYIQISGNAPGVLFRRCVRIENSRSKQARFDSSQFGNHWFPYTDLKETDLVVKHLEKV